MDAGSKDDDQITPVTSTALELAKADPSPEEAHPGAALITVSNAAIRDGSNVGLNTTSPDASLIAGEKLLVGQRDDVENDAEKQEGVQVSGEAGPKPEYISPVNGINGKPQPSVHDAMRSPEDMLNQNSGSLSAFGAKYLYPSRAPGDGVEHGTENHGQGKTIDHIGSRPEPSTPFPAIVSNASVRLPKRPVENGLPNNEEPNDRAGVGLVNIDDFEEPVHSDLDDDNSDSNSELEFKAMMRAKSEGIEDEDDENENEDDNVRRSARRSVPVRRWSSSEASASSDGGGDDDSDYAVDNGTSILLLFLSCAVLSLVSKYADFFSFPIAVPYFFSFLKMKTMPALAKSRENVRVRRRGVGKTKVVISSMLLLGESKMKQSGRNRRMKIGWTMMLDCQKRSESETSARIGTSDVVKLQWKEIPSQLA